jgi:hypothetical protein
MIKKGASHKRGLAGGIIQTKKIQTVVPSLNYHGDSDSAPFFLLFFLKKIEV